MPSQSPEKRGGPAQSLRAAQIASVIALTVAAIALGIAAVSLSRSGRTPPPRERVVAPVILSVFPEDEEAEPKTATGVEDRAVAETPPIDEPPLVPAVGENPDFQPDAGGEPDGGRAVDEDAAAPAEPQEEVAVAEEPPQEEEGPGAPIVCGPVTCPAGWVCCNESCGVCTQPGERCSQRNCSMAMQIDSVSCGPTTCAIGEVCCDPACGRCVRPGQPCSKVACLSPVEYPMSESCGMATCNVGMVCCNPSCGICARPGEPCSKRVCS